VTEPSGTLPAANARLVPPASISIILTAMTIYGNHLVTDDPVSQPMVIGGGFVILSLAVMNTVSSGLADVFALLLFIVAFLRYGPAVLTAIGIVTLGGGSTSGTT
jgi:hypothetical protein